MSDDYLMKVFIDVNQAKQAITDLKKEFKKGIVPKGSFDSIMPQLQVNLKRAQKAVTEAFSAGFNNKGAPSITDALSKSYPDEYQSNQLKSARSITDAVNQTYGKAVPMAISANKMFGSSIRRVTAELNSQISSLKKMKDVRVPFAGWAMSIMFFGMAMKQAFTQIARFGTTTFMEISKTLEGTTNNSILLEGEMKYLGFVIGDALQPVIGYLIPIISSISEWIEDNPKLTAGIIGMGLALGTIFAVGGSGVLALNGFKELLGMLGLLKPLLTFIGGLSLGTIAGAIAVIATAVAAWKADIGDIQTFFSDTLGISLKTFQGIFEEVFGVISELFNLVVNVMEGDWDGVMVNLQKITLGTVRAIVKAFTGIGFALINTFILASNISIDVFKLLVDSVLWGIEKMASALGKVDMVATVQGIRDSSKSYFEGKKTDYLSMDDLMKEYDSIDATLTDVRHSESGKGATVINIGGITVDDPMLAKSILDITNQHSAVRGYNNG